jgi:DNA-binding transcriptional regulator YdaS (Cro superfamily)
MEPNLKQAIELVGGVAALARRVGVTSQAVSQWTRAPAKRVLGIEGATGGKVTRYALRPDIFGEPPSAAA